MNKKEVKKTPTLRFKGFTNDWEQRKLGDISEIIRGASPRPISDPKWFNSNSNIGWLRISDVTAQHGRIQHLSQHISILGQAKTRVISTPHLLLSIAASVGYPVINYVKTGVHDGFLIFENPKFNIDFGFYWLAFYKHEWQKFGQPGSQVNLNSSIVKKTNIELPDNVEQKAIVHLLKLIDNCITLQQRKLKLLKEIRKGIVENIRDNNFEYKEQKNDFKDVKIKDMFKITRGKVLPKEKISSNKISPNIYPVFSSQTLNNGLLGFYKDYLFQNAITWTTDGANAGTVNFRNEKFYSTNVNGVLLQKKIKPDLLTADLLNLVAFKYVSKVGNPKLMNNTMANIRIKIPSNTNARIFYSKILNKYDTKIDFINKKIDYLTTFKRFLLQNMFI